MEGMAQAVLRARQDGHAHEPVGQRNMTWAVMTRAARMARCASHRLVTTLPVPGETAARGEKGGPARGGGCDAVGTLLLRHRGLFVDIWSGGGSLRVGRHAAMPHLGLQASVGGIDVKGTVGKGGDQHARRRGRGRGAGHRPGAPGNGGASAGPLRALPVVVLCVRPATRGDTSANLSAKAQALCLPLRPRDAGLFVSHLNCGDLAL